MSFSDVFKESFLEGFESIDVRSIAVALALSCLFAFYIFIVYRVMTKKTFYSKTFNIALAGVTVITTAIILTIQSSIVVSLGMVGALSIVRFRPAVKEPMDLMFLFWSISVGIICGAGIAEIAVFLSIILTVGIFVLDRLPNVKSPMLFVVNATDLDAEARVMEIVNKHARHPRVKSRNMTKDTLDLIIELRTDSGDKLIREAMELDGISSASLMTHDGEATL